MKSKILTLLITTVVCVQFCCAQNSKLYFGWDLSYESVLEKNNVDRKEWIWKWFKSTYYKDYDPKYETPAKKWISESKGEPIISSILIDYPAFHAAEHSTIWLFRTKNKAYYWELVDDGKPELEKKEVEPQVFDKIYEQMFSWEQLKPLSSKEIVEQIPPGYIGFLSLYREGKSSQMLLTFQDFVICDDKECNKQKAGRIFVSLDPVLSN